MTPHFVGEEEGPAARLVISYFLRCATFLFSFIHR